MAASEEAPTSVASEAVEKEPETLDIEVEKTLASTEEKGVLENHGGGESSSTNAGTSSPPAGEESGKTLEYSAELMDKGSEAMKAGDFTEAADCFSRAVEIRVGHYGELASECSSAYYKYGCALLYKAQEEADPLGSVPKKDNFEKDRSVPKGECSETSVINDAKHDGDSSNNEGETNDGIDEKEQEDDDEESEGDDLAEPDEDDSDLDLAWKMLDVARAIVEKNPDDTMEKVDILSALGEVALEREDIETSLSDYLNALSILERLVESDDRHIAELNFRICLVLEVGSKPDEAMPYCQKAISVCKARLLRLKDEVKNLMGSATTMDPPNTNPKVDEALGGQSDFSVTDKEDEIKTLTGLSAELEKKLEDLQQLVLHPTSILSDFLKMVASKSTGSENAVDVASTSLGPSQMDTNTSGGGGFDTPTVSTAHTNGNGGVTHLGVVGRGVKRVLMNSDSAESSPLKKPSDAGEKEGGA